MNHFMLPKSKTGQWGKVSASMRYGNHAMEMLINDIIKRGCAKENLEIKVFGGASVSSGTSTVGDQNCHFVREYLQFEGLRCTAYDLGGDAPRRIHYFPETGRVKRLLLRRSTDWSIAQDETRYQSRISTEPVHGDIELFDVETGS